MSVAGFGSLLSVKSARSTFPDLLHFRQGKVCLRCNLTAGVAAAALSLQVFVHVQIQGYRRVFAHTAAVFFQRGIARPETGEISSLSCEPCAGGEIVVSVFEVPFTPSAVQASSTEQHRRFKPCPWQLPAAACGCLSGSLCKLQDVSLILWLPAAADGCHAAAHQAILPLLLELHPFVLTTLYASTR